MAVAALAATFFLSSRSDRAEIVKPEKLSGKFNEASATNSQSAGESRELSEEPSISGSSAAKIGTYPVPRVSPYFPDVTGQSPFSQDDEREREIQRVFNEVLKDLEKRAAITPDTVYLESGEVIQCTVIEDSGARPKIRRQNVTITIEKEKIKRVEHRTSEDIDRELRRMAQEQATRAVDQGLVWDGQQWVAREETTAYKKEFILAFLRTDKATSTNLLGGDLWLYPDTVTQAGQSSNNAALRSFKASGKKLDLGRVCDLFPSPIKAAGNCDAEMAVKLDERNPTGLSGWATFNGEQVTLSSIDAGVLGLPTNRQASLSAKLSAGGGKIFIESFAVAGKAYDLSGGGVIRLSGSPQQKSIDFSFSVVFKEPPTVRDRELVRMGAGQYVDSLVASRTAVPLRLVGPLKNPAVQPVPGSALDSLLKQIGR
ncbi:MAG: hypothetical protein HY801_10110 [Candidatus Lindowbacteria bacterium]|nr:hypothetical protein [Candidatus Lindowbacteria bacterium]